jgi:hypothetical protein
MESLNTSADQDSDTVPKDKAPESIADKEMAYKKRQAEQAKIQKKADEQAKAEAAKEDNCKKMREYKQSLDSGMRIAQIDPNGNRSYLTDDKRAEELNTLNQNLSGCGN